MLNLLYNVFKKVWVEKIEGVLKMKNAFISYWRNAFNIKGRADRNEFWLAILSLSLMWTVIYLILFFIFGNLNEPGAKIGMGIVSTITIVPNFTLLARRVRDSGSAWTNACLLYVGLLVYVLPSIIIMMISVLCYIWLFILTISPSKKIEDEETSKSSEPV